MLIGVFSVLIWGVSRLRINQDINAILPKGKAFEGFTKLINNKNLNNKVLFLVTINDSTSAEEAEELVVTVSTKIDSLHLVNLSELSVFKENLQEELYQYYFAHFPEIIDTAYYKLLAQKIAPDSLTKAFSQSYRNLVSPGGDFLKKFIVNDPINLTGDFFKKLEQEHLKSEYTVQDGLMYSQDKKSVLFYANLVDTTGKGAETLLKQLTDFKQKWNSNNPTHSFDFFGSFEIFAENAAQVKKDTILTLSLTVAAILLILLLYYRKWTIPILFMLPTLFTVVFTFGIIGIVRPTISGLSIATGCVLLGMVIDYSFHFFTHLQHTKSLTQTVKEISAPLITGSITTVLAFGALLFANSKTLQDFGLFASLCLFGAVAFTLLVLPVVLSFIGFEFDEKARKSIVLPTIPARWQGLTLVLVVLITVVLFIESRGIQFDSDLNHLSYHTETLKQKEDKFVGINPDKQSKMFLFASGKSYAEALTSNYELFKTLRNLKEKGSVDDFTSTGDFLIPIAEKHKRIAHWNAFWQEHANETFYKIDSLANKMGFEEHTFDVFKSWTSTKQAATNNALNPDLISKLELDNLITINADSSCVIISTCVVTKAGLENVKRELSTVQGVSIFDRNSTASSLIELVQADFNFLFYISALIVFIALLLIYGRIELTLIAFLPMAISWVWILGIAAFLGIKFNFVNIIITTFIFGLGDDFSIFITDGLLSKYRSKRNSLQSFQSAILLSALTTVIGTGVLIFAKHPAIQSIALISVLGIVCIVVVSVFVQPIIFNFLIQKRVDQKKAPLTLFTLLFSWFSFVSFWLGCVIPTLLLVLLLILPFSKLRKRAICNFMLSLFAKVQIYLGIHIKKTIEGRVHLTTEKPAIIIANHSSFLDILLIIMLSPKIVLVVKDWVYKSPVFGWIIRYAGYIYAGEGPELNLEKARKLLSEGYSIAIFPEGSRSENGSIKRFHKGAFLLAKELGVAIQPILIHGAHYVLAKNDFLIKRGHLNVRILPRIESDNMDYGNTYSELSKGVAKYFKEQYHVLKNEKEDGSYLFNRLFQNFVFKGPTLEWYLRVKWVFEHKNYQEYDLLIGNRKNILDVGCGYGFLSYFLHYRDETRLITGIDYDHDKIEVAQNGYDLGNSIKFVACDLTQYAFQELDVIFFNDVLHYLSTNEQLAVLEKATASLSENGSICIRDGVTNLHTRHEKTLHTESYSTKIIKFNKTTQELNFFDTHFIEKFAVNNGLSYQLIEQSKKTSNVLFVLTKKSA